MSTGEFDRRSDGLILAARLLMMILFVAFGCEKLLHFEATVALMGHAALPLPAIAAVVAIVMELPVAIAIAVGWKTRPLAALLALYTLATAFIGHHYWTLSGAERMGNEIHFYKNIAIMGGLLLLAATGAGRYSVDRS